MQRYEKDFDTCRSLNQNYTINGKLMDYLQFTLKIVPVIVDVHVKKTVHVHVDVHVNLCFNVVLMR